MLAAAIICVAGSSQIAHEFGSRFLDTSLVLGVIVNVRAVSCALHILGIAVGLGYAAFVAREQLSLARSKKCAVAFFLAQALFVAIFYTAFNTQWIPAIVISQGFIAALSAFFIAGLVHYCTAIEHSATFLFIALCVIVPPFIAQGLFGAIASAPLIVVAIAHVALLGCSLVCSLVFFRRQSSNTSFSQLSQPYSMQLVISSGPQDGQFNLIQPWMLIWVIIFAYGAVFGFLHVIPLGLPTPPFFGINSAPIVRISSALLGAGIAAALFSSSFGTKSIDTTAIWNRFYRLVFPLAVLAALLIPFTQAQGYLLSITCSETALFYLCELSF